MDFGLSRGGILVPKLRENDDARRWWRRTYRWIPRIVGAFVVAIQLFTALVLWRTYTHTVIPQQQKELLAEQVAMLEKEKINTTQQIEQNQGLLKTLSMQTLRQREELRTLSADREALGLQVNELAMSEKKTNADDKEARARLAVNKEQLAQAQKIMFHSRAALQIFATVGRHFAKLSPGPTVSGGSIRTPNEIISEEEKNWTDYREVTGEAVVNIRAMDSKLFPRTLTLDFASLFQKSAESFVCKPDFDKMRQRYDKELRLKASSETAAAYAAEEDVIKAGVKAGIRYVIDPKIHALALDQAKQRAVSDVDYEISIEYINLKDECDKKYFSLSDGLLDKYVGASEL